MKWTIIFILILLSTQLVFSQNNYWNQASPYELSWKKDLVIGGGAIGVLVLGIQADKNEAVPDFEMGSFTQADIDAINFLDRGVAGRWDLKAKDAGKIFKFTARYLVPVSVISMPGSLKSRATLGTMFLEGYLLNGGITSFAKGKTNRYRPFAYLNTEQIEALTGEAREKFLEDIVDDDLEDSFFSGDASTTAYGLTFFAKVFSDTYPDSKWKNWVWGASLTGTALGAYFRAKSGKHFPTDVIVGSLVGGGIGYLIPHLHKKRDDSKALSLIPSGNGIALVYKWK